MPKRQTRKIVPKAPTAVGDTPFGDLNFHSLGPPESLVLEWQQAGIQPPILRTMREQRLSRLREQLRRANCDGALFYDPINIRYASDTTNMSIWTMHNAVRYLFIATDGPVVLFEFSDADFLAGHSEVIDEVRPATSYMNFYAGSRIRELASKWASEIVDLLKEHGHGERRLAIDNIELSGLLALKERDVKVVPAMPIVEDARRIKTPQEIVAMRCAIDAAQRCLLDLRAATQPGKTELELWALMQEANCRRYGEWMETRLLTSGQRTNPWYQEASSKRIQAGDLLAFDTDLIGAFGMCVDISRTWFCGDGHPKSKQIQTHELAKEQIERNLELHLPGTSFREITEKAWYPAIDSYRNYTCISHGVGLCDEYPAIYPRERWRATGYDGLLEPGMVMCVEAFVGPRAGGEGVKIEQQILITADGYELLTDFPIDLMILPLASLSQHRYSRS